MIQQKRQCFQVKNVIFINPKNETVTNFPSFWQQNNFHNVQQKLICLHWPKQCHHTFFHEYTPKHEKNQFRRMISFVTNKYWSLSLRNSVHAFFSVYRLSHSKLLVQFQNKKWTLLLDCKRRRKIGFFWHTHAYTDHFWLESQRRRNTLTRLKHQYQVNKR